MNLIQVGGSVIAVAQSVGVWLVGDTTDAQQETQPHQCRKCLRPARPGENDQTIKMFRGHRVFRRYLRKTLFHGFGYCLRSTKDKLKYLWPSMVAICSAALAVQVFKSTVDYAYEKPSTRYDIVPQQKMSLPGIVLCIPGHFDARKVGPNTNMSTELARFLLHGFAMYPANLKKDQFTMDTMLRLHARFWNYIRLHNTSYHKIANGLSVNVKRSKRAWSCRLSMFGKREPGRRCLLRQFWSWLGFCMEFRPGVHYRGMPHGFDANFRPFNELFIPGLDGRKSDGAHLLLSSDGEMEQTPVFLPTGYVVKMILQPALVKTIPSRENGCVPATTFSYDSCIYRCRVKERLGECKCTSIDAIMVETKNRSVCNPLEVVQCQTASHANSTQRQEQSKTAIARCIAEECKQSCVRWDVKDHVKLRLTYETSDLLVIEQFYSTTFGDFVGVIGGHCGLWLGGSVVAFVHLLTFWTKVAWKRCRKWLRKSKLGMDNQKKKRVGNAGSE